MNQIFFSPPTSLFNVINTQTNKIFNGVISVIQQSGYSLSAGVYDVTGNYLLRTLTSGEPLKVVNSIFWDGKDDAGNVLANGNYQIKYLTAKVAYTWEGGVGNTSTDLTGDYVTKAIPADMAFIGSTGYMATGYSEHGSTQKSFSVSDPNKWTSALYEITTQSSSVVCTDGNIIYWAGGNGYSGDAWVFGAYPADNNNPSAAMAPFASGVVETNNDASGYSSYNNAISVTKGGNYGITDMCVQKSGNYLFVSRNSKNELQVLNKISGALVQTLTFQGIRGISCDNSGHLYVAYNSKLYKFTINPDGTLTDLGTTFSGITTPGRMDISPDYSTIAVGDDATKQVKFYSVNGGAPTTVFGQSGGYALSPWAANDKFYSINFVRYQPNGSIWIGDTGNYRALHFNSNLVYINQVAHVPSSRTCSVDQNNPTRVFSNFIEYEVDYSKTLDNGTNGSWKFKANWTTNYTFATESFNDYTGFRDVNTLNNGKTYGTIYQSNGTLKEVELTNSGLRYTGADIPGSVSRDGTVFYINNVDNNYVQAFRRRLTGFDNNNNPIREAASLFSSTPSGINFFDQPGTPYNRTTGLTASADQYIWFNNSTPQQSFTNHPTFAKHLGATKQGDNKYVWQTARANRTDYGGPFPLNGDWDVGGGVNSANSPTYAIVYDDDIFFNQNAELSRFVEANEWNHFNKNGLFVGHFGTNAVESRLLTSNPAMMAGNAIGYQICKVGNDYYLYHCDESYHGFVHRWKITGLSTVSITTIPITLSAPITKPADAADLMAGLPRYSTGFYNGSGWTAIPSTGDAASVQYPSWRISTTVNTYLDDDNDIYIESDNNSDGSFKTLSRTLGSNSTNNWTLSGAFKVNRNINNKTNYQILDAAGKVLMTFYTNANGLMYVNDAVYQPTFNNFIASYKFIPFVFSNVSGQMQCSINSLPAVNLSSYESGGKPMQPADFRLMAGGSGDNNHTLVSIKGLRFEK